jgi:hypothetical protein
MLDWAIFLLRELAPRPMAVAQAVGPECVSWYRGAHAIDFSAVASWWRAEGGRLVVTLHLPRSAFGSGGIPATAAHDDPTQVTFTPADNNQVDRSGGRKNRRKIASRERRWRVGATTPMYAPPPIFRFHFCGGGARFQIAKI